MIIPKDSHARTNTPDACVCAYVCACTKPLVYIYILYIKIHRVYLDVLIDYGEIIH